MILAVFSLKCYNLEVAPKIDIGFMYIYEKSIGN